MNILVTSLPDLRKIPVQRAHHLLSYLSQYHNIKLLSVNAWWLPDRKDRFFESKLKKLEIQYLTERKFNPIVQELYSALYFNKDYSRNLSNFDIHLNLNSLLLGYFLTRKLAHLGIPTVFDICDDLPELIGTSPQIPSVMQVPGKYIGRFMCSKNFNASKSITYITQSLSNTYHIPIEKSIRIPNGVDTDFFAPRMDDSFNCRYSLGLDNESFIVGFIGNMDSWIDFDPMFSALSQLRKSISIKLLIVGGGNKLEYFKILSHRYGISKDVIFTGPTPYSEGPKLISCFDVCVVCRKTSPDSHNSLPIKIFEYMACGKPVISPRLKGVMETVGDLILYASNSKEIEEIILDLYYNDILMKKMGLEGRDYVNKSYSWHEICRQFEEVLLRAHGD